MVPVEVSISHSLGAAELTFGQGLPNLAGYEKRHFLLALMGGFGLWPWDGDIMILLFYFFNSIINTSN